MKQENRGQISVYACVVLCVFLALILVVLQGIRIWEGKAKCNQAVVAACKSIKGDYQPDLFRRYHLLALDQTYYGRGEGYLEERMKAFLEYNLNPPHSFYHFIVSDLALTDTKALTDDNLTGMKQQIADYMELRTPVLVLETVLEKANDVKDIDAEDGLAGLEQNSDEKENPDFSPDIIQNITSDNIRALGLEDVLRERGITDLDHLTVHDLLNMNLMQDGAIMDPREIIKAYFDSDILYLVMPQEITSISRENMDLRELPSYSYTHGNGGMTGGRFQIRNVKEFIQSFQQDVFWKSLDDVPKAEEEVYGMLYALDTFQYAGKKSEDQEPHALEYEVEYILAGKETDYDNMTKVADDLTFIRFIPNALFAISNQEMQKETLLLATIILSPFGLSAAAEPVSYVLLACWTYGESVLDVKCLLHGETVPVVKDRSTWQLSLNGLKDLVSEEGSGCGQEQGLNYQEYLLLMLATMPDSNLKYYRMLDLMQLNIQEQIPEFKIENCIDSFQVQIGIRENGRTWNFIEEESYIQE